MGRANGILQWQANETQQRQASAQKAAFQAKVDKASEELKVETAKSEKKCFVKGKERVKNLIFLCDTVTQKIPFRESVGATGSPRAKEVQ